MAVNVGLPPVDENLLVRQYLPLNCTCASVWQRIQI